MWIIQFNIGGDFFVICQQLNGVKDYNQNKKKIMVLKKAMFSLDKKIVLTR